MLDAYDPRVRDGEGRFHALEGVPRDLALPMAPGHGVQAFVLKPGPVASRGHVGAVRPVIPTPLEGVAGLPPTQVGSGWRGKP